MTAQMKVGGTHGESLIPPLAPVSPLNHSGNSPAVTPVPSGWGSTTGLATASMARRARSGS